MNIIQFIKHVLHDSLSPYQETGLRLQYGLQLNAEQLEIARAALDVSVVVQREHGEGTYIKGRRGGGSERIGANIAVYEATMGGHERFLSRGERAHIVLVAQEKRAGRVDYRYVLGKLESSPMLSQQIEAVRSEEIDLKNRITISIFPCSFRAPRGFSIPVAILDEFAFFRVEGVNVDKEIVDSIRPAMAQFPRSKLIKISSPYSKAGELYRDFATRHQRPDLLCFRATSKQMNPSLSDAFLESERQRDPEFYDREYMAQFSDSISNAFAREAVEACIAPGRFELPFDESQNYKAACDPAGGGSDEFTLSVVHREGQRIVQDVIRGWKAKQPQSVVAEAAAILKSYRCHEIVGDRYSGSWVQTAFAAHGIRYKVAELTASEAFLELLPAVNQGSVELLDDKVQTAQLLALERRSGRSGRDSLGHPSGGHDDRANVIALAVAGAAQQKRKLYVSYIGAPGVAEIDSDGWHYIEPKAKPAPEPVTAAPPEKSGQSSAATPLTVWRKLKKMKLTFPLTGHLDELGISMDERDHITMSPTTFDFSRELDSANLRIVQPSEAGWIAV